MYVMADIGGTKTRIAGSHDLESFTEPVIFETPPTYAEGIARIIETVRTIIGGETVDMMVMGVPGVVSSDHTTLVSAPHLAWLNQPIAHDIANAFGTRVHLENDAAQVGLGEAVYGAGKGVTVVVYITVSTGVGGVRIVNGRIDSPDTSSEMGHQYLHVGDTLQDWEAIISGTALQKRFGLNPRELGADHPVWEELARETAIGIHNATLYWTPDRIVLGGSMFNEIGISVERVAFHLKNIMTALPVVPEVVHSSLGDIGGLWGGMARLKQL